MPQISSDDIAADRRTTPPLRPKTARPRSPFAAGADPRAEGGSLPGRAAPFRPSPHPLANRLARALWGVAWAILFRPSPRIFNGWRRTLLRFFGGRIGRGVVLRPSARIWAPWNLEMGPYSTLGDQVDCYSADAIRIGATRRSANMAFCAPQATIPTRPT